MEAADRSTAQKTGPPQGGEVVPLRQVDDERQ
jgi:hypothetical protein